MKTIFIITLSFLFVSFPPNAFAQKDTQLDMPLPESAKFRIGKGTLGEIAYSPDGTRFAVSSSIGVWTYDSLTGKELNQLTDRTSRTTGFRSIRFSPDGKTIATEGLNETVLLWNASTGRLLGSIANVKYDYSFDSICFSPDGDMVAAAVRDEKDGRDHSPVALWDVKTGKYLRTFTKSNFQSYPITMLFSPDGKTFTTWSSESNGSNQKRTALGWWDVDTGQQISTVEVPTKTVLYDLRFLPDDRTFVTQGRTKLDLWDIRTGQHLKTVIELDSSGSDNRIKEVRFSPDGKTFVILNKVWRIGKHGGEYATIAYLWNISTQSGKYLKSVKNFSSICFSPDGKILISIDASDGKVCLWDTNTGNILSRFFIRSDTIDSSDPNIYLSPNGKVIATSGSDGTIYLWSSTTGQSLLKLVGHTGSVSTFSFSPDGITILSKGSDNTVRLWDALTGKLLKTHMDWTDPVHFVSFSPDGKILVSAGWSKHVRLWDVNAGHLLKTLNADSSYPIKSIYFSQDGRTIAANTIAGPGRSHELFLWTVGTGELLQAFTGSKDEVLNIALPDGEMMAIEIPVQLLQAFTGSKDEVLNIALPDGEMMAIKVPVTSKGEDSMPHAADISMEQFPKEVEHLDESVSFSPDREIVALVKYGATEGDMSRLYLWNINTGQILKTIESLSGFSPISFSPNGRTIAASYSDYSDVDLWDVNTGRHLHTLSGHLAMPYCGGGTVSTIHFSPDGDIIATGSADTTIRLWSTKTGEHLKTLTGHTSAVNSVAFNPDGKTLASGSDDGTILLWEVP